MSTDRAKHEFEDLKGKAKEKIGDATDNRSLQAEGLVDQAKAKAGKVADNVREATRRDDTDPERIRTDDERGAQ